jgi:radical SAM superfamily enzyme YgiQ (UPF0313 family)
VGAANLGFQYVFSALRRLGVGVERFFLSPIPDRSVDSDAPIHRFPVVTASISCEEDLASWVEWLRRAGIRTSPEERKERGEPLLGAGGGQTSINPLPLIPICDFIVLGDGEPVLPFLVERIRRGGTREELWRSLAEHPSILVPPLFFSPDSTAPEAIPERLLSRMERPEEGEGMGAWVSPRSCFSSSLLLELQRGCARGCSYCVLPRAFAPCRALPLVPIRERLDAACERRGFDRVGLVTPEASDYPELPELLETAFSRGLTISFASLRADGLTDFMLSALARGNRREITLAPEAGSDRLRRLCGKGFGNDLLVERARRAREYGIRAIKLYFMIGLPEETDEDLRAIAELALRVRAEADLRPIVSVAPFVPKPTSAWSARPFAGVVELRRRTALLRRFLGSDRAIESRFAGAREAESQYGWTWSTPRAALRRFLPAGESARTCAPGGETDRDEVLRMLKKIGVRVGGAGGGRET